jgi:hypothetical protein
MFLFDANDVLRQYDMYARVAGLETDRGYYLHAGN